MRVPFSIPTRGHVTAALGRVYVARERVSVARVLVTAGVVLAGVFAVAEVAHWRSSHRRLGDYEGAGGHRARNAHLTGLTPTDSDQIIVVLGYANRGQRPNGINRFRVLAGLRSIDSRARSSLLIFCGGAVTDSHRRRSSSNASLKRNSPSPADQWLRRRARRRGRTSPTRSRSSTANSPPSRRSASSRTLITRRKPVTTCGRCDRTWHADWSAGETTDSVNIPLSDP